VNYKEQLVAPTVSCNAICSWLRAALTIGIWVWSTIFFLSSKHDPATPAPINGAVHIISVVIKHVMSSADEAELVAILFIAQDACSICVTLEEFGHPHSPTAIQTNNECTKGIANKTVKQQRSKAMDMRFYWTRNRIKQLQLLSTLSPENQLGLLLYQASSTAASPSHALHLFAG
jgi:hypothetical protein